MKIIGLWSGSISGEFTTVVDLFYNLKKYIDVDFHLCILDKKLMSNCIRHLTKNNNSDLLKYITLNTFFESNCIICSSFIIYNKIELKTKNLFILDSFDLRKNNYNIPELKNKNIIFFSNPANITKTIPYKQIEYYHKFSYERLNNFPIFYKKNLSEGNLELFLDDNFYYKRTKKSNLEIFPGEYFENIGKRIFEHLYHKKNVFYNSEGFSKPDGLFYYLKLFGIDANLSCNLKLLEHIIKEKLFMNEDDELLKTIRNCNVN